MSDLRDEAAPIAPRDCIGGPGGAYSGDPLICFVSAPGGSAFMVELMEVLADAVRRAGGAAVSYEGAIPVDGGDAVYVVIPHEYFVIVPGPLHPSVDTRSRVIGLCVEHPGTSTFETFVANSRGLGAVMATSSDALMELQRRGVAAELFVLGYSPIWDQWGGRAAERPVDMVYLGTLNTRRSKVIGSWAPSLWNWQTRLLMPPHEPMTRPRPYFLMAHEKWRLLASAKILLNLHRDGAHALEWVRVLEAACNGCVVVSERSVGCGPLVPGEHFVVGRPENLATLASTLLRHPDRLEAIREAAYELCRSRLDMTASARHLLEIARSLAGSVSRTESTLRSRTELSSADPPMDDHLPLAVDRAPSAPSAPDVIRAAVWGLVERDRRQRQTEARLDNVQIEKQLMASDVDVVIIEDNCGVVSAEAVTSVRKQLTGAILGLRTTRASAGPLSSCSSPRAVDIPVRAFPGGWLELCHGVMVGRGFLLNEAIRTVRAPLTLVATSDMRFFPTAVAHLLDTLRATGSRATFSLVRRSDGTLGNVLPPEARRLASYPYLGAGFLVVTEDLWALGGIADDPALEGLEFHDFWCRFVEAGLTATLVPEILVAESESTGQVVLRPIDIDQDRSWQELRRRSPHIHGYLSGGKRPPLPPPVGRLCDALGRNEGSGGRPRCA